MITAKNTAEETQVAAVHWNQDVHSFEAAGLKIDLTDVGLRRESEIN